MSHQHDDLGILLVPGPQLFVCQQLNGSLGRAKSASSALGGNFSHIAEVLLVRETFAMTEYQKDCVSRSYSKSSAR